MKVRVLLGAEDSSIYQHPQVLGSKSRVEGAKNRGLNPGDIINPHHLFRGTWMPEWLDEKSELSERAKKLCPYLTHFAGGKGKAWPKLAKKLRVSRRHVIRIIHELVKHRLIRITRVHDVVSGKQTNIYELLWHEWIDLAADT